MANIVLTDDHSLLRSGLASLIKNLGHNVLFEADNGNDFLKKLDKTNLPELVLLDINMPEMDGYETARWINTNHPEIKTLILSMYDSESSIIRMLQYGARGYILKDSDPTELRIAVDAVLSNGYYFSDLVSGKLVNAVYKIEDKNPDLNIISTLNERETSFLKYACSELTYREIAAKMFLSPRTIDGYRESLFEKLNVKTRVGLVMFAIKNSIVQFD